MVVAASLRLAALLAIVGLPASVLAAEEKPKSTAATKAAPPAAEQKAAEPKKVEGSKKAVDAKPAAPAATTKVEVKATATVKVAVSKPRKPTEVKPGDDDVKLPPKKPFTPGGKYVAGDLKRPRPAVITPPTASDQRQAGRAPSDAVLLFDGTDLANWVADGQKRDAQGKPIATPPQWIIKNDYMECTPRSGGISTKDSFGDCQLHIEWATPSVVKGSSQGRGNSGILLHGIGEVQVLDSYDNDTYPDGQAAAIYGKYPPLVNASRKPGEWQTYDIILELARKDAMNKVVRPLRITVLHNGVLVHHGVELESTTSQFRFGLQDHGNPVRYRNIWLRPLKGYDSAENEIVAQAATEPKNEAKVDATKPAETKKIDAKPATAAKHDDKAKPSEKDKK
jgi:hypothetical protein